MAELVFDCVDVRSDRYAAGPTLTFRLRVAETTRRAGARHRPARARSGSSRRSAATPPAEADRLGDLFGDSTRWADTLKPLQLANTSVMVPSFTGSVEVDLPVPFTYDLEIASTSYFHALEEGEAPLILLFSGTLFTKGANGFSVGQVPWHKEATYRLPVAEWRSMMDTFFPGGGWLRVSRSTLEALGRVQERPRPADLGAGDHRRCSTR